MLIRGLSARTAADGGSSMQVTRIFETVIYAGDLAAAERFYLSLIHISEPTRPY